MPVSCPGHELDGEGILPKIWIKLCKMSLKDFSFRRAPSVELEFWSLAKMSCISYFVEKFKKLKDTWSSCYLLFPLQK